MLKKKKNISKNLKEKIDKLKTENFYLEIEEIKKAIRKVKIDKFEFYYPRLISSQIQNCFINNNKEMLKYYLDELFSNEKFLNKLTFNDLTDLISRKFVRE